MMRTVSMCYSNFQVHKICLKSPCIRLASIGRTWARNFNVLSSSSSSSCTAHESSAKCFRSIKFSDAPSITFWDDKTEPPLDVLVFDLETSRLSYRTGRIVEIGIRRVQGGKNSCFQTLVNPEQNIPNSYIHRLRTDIVRHADVPTMKQAIPILLRFIQCRQQPERQVVLVAHNARTFDVRILIEEFRRCSFDIPHEWLFLDTLPLAREVRKLYAKRLRGPESPESQIVQTLPKNLRLQTLGHEFYMIPKEGEPHRAMTDVNLLTCILEKMISDLGFGPDDLLERAFKASDLNNSKKKKS